MMRKTCLVGVSINANNLDGVSKSACKMGRANAPVFPDPVSASPMMSRPALINHYLILAHDGII